MLSVDKSEDGEGGFEIYEDVDADEPLAVSREETYKPPDYRSFIILIFTACKTQCFM